MKNPFLVIMEKENYNYRELGDLLGTSKQVMYNIVNDINKPSCKVILNLLVLFPKYVKPLDLLIYYEYKEKLTEK